MRKFLPALYRLGLSRTARNTYVLFAGNVLDAFFGFLFIVLIVRNGLLSTSDFGIFSAIANFVIVIYSLLDIGIGGTLINFISYYHSRGDEATAHKYFQAGLFLRSGASLLISLVVMLFSWLIGPRLFLTQELQPVILAGVAILTLSLIDVFVYSFQAYQKFLSAALASLTFTSVRLIFLVVFMALGRTLSLTSAMAMIALAPLLGIVLSAYHFRSFFSFRLPEKSIIKPLLSFSGWMGVTRVFSSITGRLDVQQMLLLAGPLATGSYSVAARIASFYSIIIGSFTAVLAPKFAAGNSLSQLKSFVTKAMLAILGLMAAMVLGIIIAKPFILLLFGQKAIASVLPFQALTAAFMPFVASTLATTIIIYNLKKPKVLGLLTILQLACVFTGNMLFIPRFGSIGPAITLGITNTLVLIISSAYVLSKWR